MNCCIWKIKGEAVNGSSGGETTIFAVTESETTVPNPHEALTEASPQYAWYRIDLIEQIASLPCSWMSSDGEFQGLTDAIESLP
jgi:hypothetical protein